MQITALEETGLQQIYSKIEQSQNNFEKNVENNPNVFAKLESVKFEKDEIDLSTWFYDLKNKVKLLRGIDLPFDEAKLIYQELEKVNYSKELRTIAEMWILKGNWKYHPKKILLGDFFPTADDLKDFKGQNFAFTDLQDIIQDLRNFVLILAKKHFNTFKTALEMENKLFSLEYDKALTNLQIEVGLKQQELNSALTKIEELEKINLKLNAKIKNLEEEF